MNRGPIVYVVQEMKNRNLLPALVFGSLEPLLDPLDQVVLATAPTVRRLKAKLANFQEGDYLLAMGDPAAIGIACAVVAQRTGGFTMLKWDKQEGVYYPITVDLEQP